MPSRKGRPKATRVRGSTRMRDVAQAAGVSVMSVSRFLNDPETVSEDKRARIREAVRQSGYVPNRLARNLSSNRSNIVGMIVPSIRNSLFAETVKGMSDRLHEDGFQLMIADSGHSLEQEESLIKTFLSQRVAGLALHNTTHTRTAGEMLDRSGIPVVENGNLTSTPLDCCVSYSNFIAAKMMTLHLSRFGYQNIAFVSLAVHNNDRAAERRRGYLAALEELGRPPKSEFILERAEGFQSGAETIHHLVKSLPDVDVVFFAGDVLAIGALAECGKRGWKVPERIGIATFDDVDMLRFVTPTITSIRLPRYEIGRRSAQTLIERIEGFAAGTAILDLGFEIIQRESS